MRIAILITSASNFGKKGFYNSQEVGLAKALSKDNDVIIYKFVKGSDLIEQRYINGYENIKVIYLPGINLGINGIINLNYLDKDIDSIIYFSDTQLMVPKISKWCEKNGVKFIPYVGVIESHSDNIVNRIIINYFSKRNINIYKRKSCLAKNNDVKIRLNKGVIDVKIAPVGLDLTVLEKDYEYTNVDNLKDKWGYSANDKIILFIGRLVNEKQPLRMIEIFNELYQLDSSYRLIIVGNGILLEKLKSLIYDKNLDKYIKLINEIPNKDIWELYRISDAFINLNPNEIFGMAILEAMYYKCKVIAWKAPGPKNIIENRKNGYLVQSNKEVIEAILDKDYLIEQNGYDRVINNFTWNKVADAFKEIVDEC